MYLRVTVNFCIHVKTWHGISDGNVHVPDVLVMRNLAFVRFANPNMFKVPINDVLTVFTALNW